MGSQNPYIGVLQHAQLFCGIIFVHACCGDDISWPWGQEGLRIY